MTEDSRFTAAAGYPITGQSYALDIPPLAFALNPTILLVEDEPDVAAALRLVIERHAMKVTWAATGAEAIHLKQTIRPDIVLIDLSLPDIDGKELVRRFAAQGDCGLIVVSGRADEVDRVVGIELGADDYIAKPPVMRELVARIRAVHRRIAGPGPAMAAAAVPPMAQHLAQHPALPSPQPASLEPLIPAPSRLSHARLGTVRLDLRRRQALGRDGLPIHLTAAEYATLEMLVEAAPHPVSREQICAAALRRPFHAEDRSVDQLILNLRRKLFAGDAALSIIVSVRSRGYAIAADRALLMQAC